MKSLERAVYFGRSNTDKCRNIIVYCCFLIYIYIYINNSEGCLSKRWLNPASKIEYFGWNSGREGREPHSGNQKDKLFLRLRHHEIVPYLIITSSESYKGAFSTYNRNQNWDTHTHTASLPWGCLLTAWCIHKDVSGGQYGSTTIPPVNNSGLKIYRKKN